MSQVVHFGAWNRTVRFAVLSVDDLADQVLAAGQHQNPKMSISQGM